MNSGSNTDWWQLVQLVTTIVMVLIMVRYPFGLYKIYSKADDDQHGGQKVQAEERSKDILSYTVFTGVVLGAILCGKVVIAWITGGFSQILGV